jgi:hypothetical protein
MTICFHVMNEEEVITKIVILPVKGISVALIINRDEIHHQHIVSEGIHPINSDLISREHPSKYNIEFV